MATQEDNSFQNDRRHSNTSRNRFGWVRRLMQGQNRTAPNSHDQHGSNLLSQQHPQRHKRPSGGNTENARDPTRRHSSSGRARRNSEPLIRNDADRDLTHSGDEGEDFNTTLRFDENDHIHRSSFQGSYDDQDRDGNYNDSDQHTNNSEDNISTIPLKSIVSRQSTKNPSILSTDMNNDHSSLIASTAETSLAPSVHTSANNYITTAHHQQNNQNNLNTTTVDEDGVETGPSATATPVTLNTSNSASASQILSNAAQEGDNESIVTLASSSRRRRRRSIDTNCSTNAIPPASIMERLSVQPTAANSIYANSIRTGNYDRSSQLSHNDDQGSSVKSFN
ncbi:hypothetical protein CANMA_000089 [Candida margitis]|uniref:uncharacterized protein n=1 Tax=Candida margitis TaxID=1775924 RepID=UPI0022271CCA|nr:uncharacterized protein CANMA_000089 [Candida margitis]KAI5970929.1 hypothetical protein CANMA_000089 [Candida margitis]